MEDLKIGLEEHAQVVWDYEAFWECDQGFDIVHLHWPEFLSYEVQKYVYTTEPFPKELFVKIENCLKYWKKNATIVYTRHVQFPHARHDKDYLDLYKMVTSYCDTVVHFANYSIAQFSLEIGGKTKLHKIKSSEIYYILEGEGKLKIDDEMFNLKKDDSVYVPPNSKQFIENIGSKYLRFLCIVEPAWKAEDDEILE